MSKSRCQIVKIKPFTTILMVFLLPLCAWANEVERTNVYTMEFGEPEYLVGPGDLLEIKIWLGLEESTHDVVVKPDGSITVSFVEAKVDGLTARQIEDRLVVELRKLIREPRVSIRVKEFRSKTVTVLRSGPGSGVYPLMGRTTLIQMVTRTGGFTRDDDLGNVTVARRDGRVLQANLFDILVRGELKRDIVLDAGDTIYIPARRVDSEDNIFVFGEVTAPGTYPRHEGMTIVEALSAAKGYKKDTAKLSEVRVIRGGLANPNILTTDMDALLMHGDLTKDIPLQRGDIVFVPRDRIGNWNAFLAKIRPTLEFIVLPFYPFIYWRQATD